MAARTSDLHGYAVADIPAVLQSDREMEIPEAVKGELNKFVPAYGGDFTNLSTSILCQGYVSSYTFFSHLFCGLEHSHNYVWNKI